MDLPVLGPAALNAMKPRRPGAVLFDFHGVFTESAMPALGIPTLLDDPVTAEAVAELETGRMRMADFLAALPPQPPSGRRLRVVARPAVVAWARRLRACGIPTGLVTNTFRGFAGIRASAGVPDDLFDVVVESWRHGVRKPDPAIYLIAPQALRVPPEDCLFIDDEPANVRAASELGMRAVRADTESAVSAVLEREFGTQEHSLPTREV